MRAALLAILVLPCTGCLVHTARVEPEGDPAAGRSAVGTQVRDGCPAVERRGPLPYELPAVWLQRDAEGRLLVAHATALSPLPWWQRFPCDFAVDLWPGEMVVATTATLTPRPLTPRTADELAAEARAHGYAE